MNRYDQLLKAIDLFMPQIIVEIGTWSGYNAVRMIKQAQKHRSGVWYIGYDLFEDATDDTDAEELNLKQHYTVEQVTDYISKACPDVEFNLIKGNTRQTLKNVEADFVYIDGGHSLETVEHDYNAVKNSKVVIFDDYYIADKDGVCQDTSIVGCNKLVKGIKGSYILPMGGEVKTGGLTMMALVVGGGR